MYKQGWKAPNKEFTVLYRELAKKIGNMYDIPIQASCYTSKSITKSVGRYISIIRCGRSIDDEAIVFMDDIQNAPIDAQKSVIAHELAHLVATHVYRANCQHDYRWQRIATKISTELNIPITIFVSDESIKQMLKERDRYKLVCDKCGAVLKTYKRKPRLLVTNWMHSKDRGSLHIEKI